jgi:hypothetical protein
MHFIVTLVFLESMNTAEIASIVSTATTVIYTIGTFMLWWVTKRTLDLTIQRQEKEQIMMQVNYLNNLHRNFREVYSGILNDEEASKILAQEQGVNVTSLKKDYLGSFLINQASEAYRLSKNSLIPDDLWETLNKDMKDLFKWKFISDRWQQVKEYHSIDFQEFVESNLIYSKDIPK